MGIVNIMRSVLFVLSAAAVAAEMQRAASATKPSFHAPSHAGRVLPTDLAPFGVTQPAWDLSWVAGIEYTPSSAPGNSLWWHWYSEYAAEVERELSLAQRRYGFNHLRMFLHSMVFEQDNGTSLHAAMESFLGTATANGFKTSFVFFDDCWGGAGASLTTPCVPVEGRHNGCWFQSPQIADRTNVTRYQPYVYDTVRRFGRDPRVAFWEVYNEPRNGDPFSMALRDAGYAWALAALADANPGVPQPVPVLSCWDTNPDSQVSDMHRYDTDFNGWTSQVFMNVSSGALITEGGSRWYQTYPSDAGSTLTVLNWFWHLRAITPSPTAPWPFGMVLQWELMVGGSNTRWHWSTPDGAAEPVIPWCGHMYSDGTPVSHTEAAALRNWTTGRNDFLAYDAFLPDTWSFVGDSYACLAPGQTYQAALNTSSGTITDVLAETTVWLNASTGGGMLLRSGTGAGGVATGYFVGFPGGGATTSNLTVELWAADGSHTQLASFNMSSLNCGLTWQGWNMLRATVVGDTVSVWANPMAPEAEAGPLGIQPRLVVQDTAGTFSSGGVALVGTGPQGTGQCTRFDYIGALPPSVL